MPAASDGSVAGGDSPVNNDRPPESEQTRTGRGGVSERASFRQWSIDHKLTFLGIVLTFIAAIAGTVIIPLLLASNGNGGSRTTGQSQVQNNTNNGASGSQNQIKVNNNQGGQVGGNITNNNYGPTVGSAGLSNNPQAQIVQLTGSYSEQGFTTAILDRNTSIVALYLRSGMNAAALYQGTSAILFGLKKLIRTAIPSRAAVPLL